MNFFEKLNGAAGDTRPDVILECNARCELGRGAWAGQPDVASAAKVESTRRNIGFHFQRLSPSGRGDRYACSVHPLLPIAPITESTGNAYRSAMTSSSTPETPVVVLETGPGRTYTSDTQETYRGRTRGLS